MGCVGDDIPLSSVNHTPMRLDIVNALFFVLKRKFLYLRLYNLNGRLGVPKQKIV